MKLMLDVEIKSPPGKITYADKLFLIGSCFTEHIGRRLEELKFPVLQNPNGILFDPISVSKSINSYADLKMYGIEDLFFLNELWQSWNHHSFFSGTDILEVLANINRSQVAAHHYLKNATWMIITLGSAFSYQLNDNDQSVANCHRAPGQLFNKNLLTAEAIAQSLGETIQKMTAFNPALKIIFTISPVRHIRDGVVENNRSKARLIEAVHQLVETYDHTFYFPAYELVIDVLRDYRFYDVDLVHPNYAATEIVFDRFEKSFVDGQTRNLMEEIRKVVNAFKHKPFHPETVSHRLFMQNSLRSVMELKEKMPHIDFSREMTYFAGKS